MKLSEAPEPEEKEVEAEEPEAEPAETEHVRPAKNINASRPRRRGHLMKIGVISDTHNFLDPNPKLFSGVEHILHGGDVGLPRIIMELEQIAPVTAVLGNTDSDTQLRETEVVELAGRKFLIHHIVDVHVPSDVVLVVVLIW